MSATRQLKTFEVTNQDGKQITIQRRCYGTGVEAQKQMNKMVYDETKKKFRVPPRKSQLGHDDAGDAG